MAFILYFFALVLLLSQSCTQATADSSVNEGKTTTATTTTTIATTTTTGKVSATTIVDCINSTTSNLNITCNGSLPTAKPNSNFNRVLKTLGVTDENYHMYLRAFYVVCGVGGLVVIYLVVKTILVRRGKTKSRQYGVLNNRQLELNALDEDDEDDLFDQSRRRLIA